MNSAADFTRGGTRSFLLSHKQVSSQIPSPQRVKVNEIIKWLIKWWLCISDEHPLLLRTTHGVMKGTYIKSFCSPDLEFHMLLCRPFWLPREFTAITITAVYIPPKANTDQALKELYGNISEQETPHPDAAFVVTGDFNKANFRTITPKYFQHITINTCGDRVLDHCYSYIRVAYKSFPRPPSGKSDHSSVLLLPVYRQKLKQEAPTLRTI